MVNEERKEKLKKNMNEKGRIRKNGGSRDMTEGRGRKGRGKEGRKEGRKRK